MDRSLLGVESPQVTPMEKPVRQHIAELQLRVQQLSREIMQNRKTREERNRVEAELRVAQQALTHYQQAIKLEVQLQRGVQGTPHIAFCLSLLLLKKCLQVALRSQILIPHFCEIGVLALEVGQDEPLLISLDCGVFFDADVVIAPVVGSEFEFVSSFCQFKE